MITNFFFYQYTYFTSMCECTFYVKNCYNVYHSQHFDSLEFVTPPSCVLQITMSLKFVHGIVTVRIKKMFTMTKV
jgi:hypothetical protein